MIKSRVFPEHNYKALHFNGADRLDVKAAFRDAWNTYNRLSAADKTLVIH